LPENTRTADKILNSIKGLRNHLQPDEQPLLTVPAIWDGSHTNTEGEPIAQRPMPCDVIVTNQRLIGYVFTTFPRERLFLEQFSLPDIISVSLRQKSYEPLFRELRVRDMQHKVYIRAPRQKIENLYTALRTAIEQAHPTTDTAFEGDASVEPTQSTESTERTESVRTTPIYGRQEISTPFENSPLAITLLFVGGIVLEIGGVLLWSATRSAASGFPLCIAGFVSVLIAIFIRRQRR
jgi:hypothetical protein